MDNNYEASAYIDLKFFIGWVVVDSKEPKHLQR